MTGNICPDAVSPYIDLRAEARLPLGQKFELELLLSILWCGGLVASSYAWMREFFEMWPIQLGLIAGIRQSPMGNMLTKTFLMLCSGWDALLRTTSFI